MFGTIYTCIRIAAYVCYKSPFLCAGNCDVCHSIILHSLQSKVHIILLYSNALMYVGDFGRKPISPKIVNLSFTVQNYGLVCIVYWWCVSEIFSNFSAMEMF